MQARVLVINYAMAFLGTPYRYGGNNPLVGMDCSGFVCEVLKSTGFVKGFEDFSAKELCNALLSRGHKSSLPIVSSGCILFFGKTKEMIDHVSIAVSETAMVEAGGGDRGTISREAAEASGACVRIRPVRKDLVECILPAY